MSPASFFFNDTATTEIYTLSLHDALPIFMRPLVERAGALFDDLLAPLRIPSHPLTLARFGARGVWSAEALSRRFEDPGTKALLAGAAAHSIQPLDRSPTGGLALLLLLAGHTVGWPLVRGGSAHIARALTGIFRDL